MAVDCPTKQYIAIVFRTRYLDCRSTDLPGFAAIIFSPRSRKVPDEAIVYYEQIAPS